MIEEADMLVQADETEPANEEPEPEPVTDLEALITGPAPDLNPLEPVSPKKRPYPPQKGIEKRHHPNYQQMQQASYAEREEIRKRVREIWRQERVPKEALQLPDTPAPLETETESEESTGEEMTAYTIMTQAITEVVLFLNSGPLTSAFGALILLLAIGYLFFSRLVDPIISGLRGGLDIALDVVNYLRPHPQHRTARARILGRYTSLLKYITNWRDPQNPSRGYSRIVVLAHSQGAVITSDLLRALSLGTVADDNELACLNAESGAPGNIPIRVFAMGSPLRQLYAARFPRFIRLGSYAKPADYPPWNRSLAQCLSQWRLCRTHALASGRPQRRPRLRSL